MVDTPATTIQDYDRRGKGDWLQGKDWSPLIFYVNFILIFWIFLTFCTINTAYEKAWNILYGLIWSILIIIIMVILILYDQIFWAWVVALIPPIFIIVVSISVIISVLYGTKIPGVKVEWKYDNPKI